MSNTSIPTAGSDKLLLVDDDQELCDLLKNYLANEGYLVDTVHDGASGLEAALTGNYRVLILDVMLPAMNGIDVLKTLRQSSSLPVLMLTAKGDDLDRILGLELGADDYLPKPCNPRELVARLKAILRRGQANPANSDTEVLQSGELRLDEARRAATYANNELTLTRAEFDILKLLLSHAGNVVSKEEIYAQALGREFTSYDRSADMHVSNIRKKLAQLSAQEIIKNVRGVGYQLLDSDSAA